MPDISKWNIHGTEYNVADATARATLSGMPTDVQINGTSVVTDGVAEIPLATASAPGVGKVSSTAYYGIAIVDGELRAASAGISDIKGGWASSTIYGKAITPNHQHESTFYGLAKAAGDSTQSESANPVGTYTDNAKAAIRTMLGVTGESGMNIVSLTGTVIDQTGAANTMYVCGEVTSLTFAAPASGICAIRFASGTTATVATFTGVTAWMSGFDPTTLEANKTYEINILNGVGCAGWA